jgi:hypothetical protein
MASVFEMFSGPQGNAFAGMMAEHFRLQQEQAEKALAALMPAFSEGLKRRTSEPEGLGAFMQNLASQDWMKYARDPAAAFTPEAMKDGQALLSNWMGQNELTKAIAQQAEAMSGISAGVIQQMMPHLAPVVMGNIQNRMFAPMGMPGMNMGNMGWGGTTGSRSGDAMSAFIRSAQDTQQKFAEVQMAALSQTPFGKILEEMLRQQSGAQRRAPNPFEGTPWGDIIDQMMGGGAKRSPDLSDVPNPFNPENNPLGRIFQDMLKNSGGQAEEAEAQTPPSPKNKAGETAQPGAEDTEQAGNEAGRAGADAGPDPYAAPKGGFEDIFSDMFETGMRVNKAYEATIRNMFEDFSGKPKS